MLNVSPELNQLCTVIGALLNGPPVESMPIADAVVRLAVDRHQVGPVTCAAVRQSGHEVSHKAMEYLSRAYARSDANRRSVLLRLENVAAVLAARNIEWATLKGTLQAERLYPDPAWRMSSDIDVLVDPTDFAPAIEALCTAGFICSNPPMPAIRTLRKPLLSTLHEATLIAKDDHSCAIEVHARLFFSGRFPSLPILAGAISVPAVGPELVAYLIAHGAGCFWVRLKWLVDLVPAFAKIDPAKVAAVGEIAESAGTARSTAASLLLLRTLFPFAKITGLLPWLAKYEGMAGVRRRFEVYLAMLDLPSDWRRSPLDNRLTALKAQLLLWERAADRVHVMTAGPLASVARRLASSVNKRDRSLTISTVPPNELFDSVV